MLFLYHMRMTEEEYRWYDVLSSPVYVEEVNIYNIIHLLMKSGA